MKRFKILFAITCLIPPVLCGCGCSDQLPFNDSAGAGSEVIAPVPLDVSSVTMHQAYCGAVVLLSEDGETLAVEVSDLVAKMCELQLDLIPLPANWADGERIATKVVTPEPQKGGTIKAHIPAEWEPGYRAPDWHKKK